MMCLHAHTKAPRVPEGAEPPCEHPPPLARPKKPPQNQRPHHSGSGVISDWISGISAQPSLDRDRDRARAPPSLPPCLPPLLPPSHLPPRPPPWLLLLLFAAARGGGRLSCR
eukprot:3697588-Rhodomonas_salina.1